MASLWEGFSGKNCVFLVCGNPTPISPWWLGQRYWLLDLWHCMQGPLWIWIQDSDWCWHYLHPLHAHPRRMCTSPKFVHMLCRCAYQGAFLANEICFFVVSLLFYNLILTTALNHYHPIATITTSTPTYNYHHHTVQVAWVQVKYVRQWVKGKWPSAQVAMGDTSTGARRICSNGWKNATSTSCSQWPPPCVQVEYFRWLIEG